MKKLRITLNNGIQWANINPENLDLDDIQLQKKNNVYFFTSGDYYLKWEWSETKPPILTIVSEQWGEGISAQQEIIKEIRY